MIGEASNEEERTEIEKLEIVCHERNQEVIV